MGPRAPSGTGRDVVMGAWEWLYGRQAVRAALQAGRRRCRRLVLADGVSRKGIVAQIVAAAEEQGCTIAVLPRERLAQQVGHHGHQGVGLEVTSYPYIDMKVLLEAVEASGQKALVLLLDHLEDPQNVGNLLRTAEVAGVTGVVLPGRRAAHITPVVVNASAGAVEYLQVALVSNLAQVVAALQDAGVWVYALERTSGATLYWSADLSGPVALIVGSEGKGVGRLLMERSDGIVYIPTHGQTSSLNAATAGALAIYEVLRQRRQNRE